MLANVAPGVVETPILGRPFCHFCGGAVVRDPRSQYQKWAPSHTLTGLDREIKDTVSPSLLSLAYMQQIVTLDVFFTA